MFPDLLSLVAWFFIVEKKRPSRNEQKSALFVLSVCDVVLKGAVLVTSKMGTAGSAGKSDTTASAKAAQSGKADNADPKEQRKPYERPNFGMRVLMKTHQLLIELAIAAVVMIWVFNRNG